MRFGTGGWAIDGALACIIKTYLVVQQSDPALTFLNKVWSNVKDQMMQIQHHFDMQQQDDGIVRGWQRNTYDTSMAGPNTFVGSYYITALKAVAQMATYMKEPDFAKQCWKRSKLAQSNYERLCWKESFGYYVAIVTKDDCQNSYGIGCFVDQICAIGLSSACGFGHIFNPKHETSALLSIVKYNTVTKPPFQDLQHHLYNGDTGIAVCSYPNGKLGDGMHYDTIVSSGFTSPVIAGLLLNGRTTEACTLAKHIRQRQNGRTAGPWNEPECGMYYARTMAHWNMYDQACGFEYNSCNNGGTLSYSPKFNATNFGCFVALHGGWGRYKQQGTAAVLNVDNSEAGIDDGTCILSKGMCSLTCLFGRFQLGQWKVQTCATSVVATLDGKKDGVSVVSFQKGMVVFENPVLISKGSCLILTFPADADDNDNITTTTTKIFKELSNLVFFLPCWKRSVADTDRSIVGVLLLLGAFFFGIYYGYIQSKKSN